jgi:AcrR family transcriptional regulator
MRAEGLQRVTMRRLAQELDTGPASLYVYLANTSQLHAAILEELLGEVDLRPADASGDWRQRLVAVLESYTGVLFTYPNLARAALVARPTGPNYLALIEAILALLHEGGVPDAQASWGVDLLLQTATATAAEHAPGDGRPGADADAEADATARAEFHAVATALHAVDPATHPRIAAASGTLIAGTPGQRHAWALNAIITGTAATPLPPVSAG